MQINRYARAEDAVRAVRDAGGRVVTFVGFSGAGYEDHAKVEQLLWHELDALDPASDRICAGATPEGIGAVYALAKKRGFRTLGIVTSLAEKQGVALSQDVDVVHVVQDDSWGGADRGGSLSPTSSAMVGASDMMIAIGGGAIARDEVAAAKQSGKPVRYVAAEMNHADAIDKARGKGESLPRDFRGSVHELFKDR